MYIAHPSMKNTRSKKQGGKGRGTRGSEAKRHKTGQSISAPEKDGTYVIPEKKKGIKTEEKLVYEHL